MSINQLYLSLLKGREQEQHITDRGVSCTYIKHRRRGNKHGQQ